MSTIIKYQWVYLIFLWMPFNLLAQSNEGKISGTIRTSNGEGLFGASVVLNEINKGAVTDTLGKYNISHISFGTYTLSISSFGFKTITKTITVNSTQVLHLNFK